VISVDRFIRHGNGIGMKHSRTFDPTPLLTMLASFHFTHDLQSRSPDEDASQLASFSRWCSGRRKELSGFAIAGNGSGIAAFTVGNNGDLRNR